MRGAARASGVRGIRTGCSAARCCAVKRGGGPLLLYSFAAVTRRQRFQPDSL